MIRTIPCRTTRAFMLRCSYPAFVVRDLNLSDRLTRVDCTTPYSQVSTPEGKLPPWMARVETDAGCACGAWWWRRRGAGSAASAATRSCSELECGRARRDRVCRRERAATAPALSPRAAASHACSSCSTSSSNSCRTPSQTWLQFFYRLYDSAPKGSKGILLPASVLVYPSGLC